MRILFVSERVGYFGGVEQNVADTAAGLRQRGHTCYLAHGGVLGHDVARYAAAFEACFPCAEVAPAQQAGGADPFALALERLAPDAVYLHRVADTTFCRGLAGQARTVRMVHDHDLCCPRRHKYYALGGAVCRHPAGWRCWLDGAFVRRDRRAPAGLRLVDLPAHRRELRRNWDLDALLVGSRFMRDELLRNGCPAERVHVLPPVVQDQGKLLPPSPEPRLLYVGQLVRGKGVDLLLRALRLVERPCILEVAGTGNHHEALEDLARALGLAWRVQFHGFVDHRRLGELYARARAVVVPSRWPEPFGMIGLEAMRRGRPVIAFAAGGIPDWLEHEVTGLLVRERDVRGLAAAMERLLADDGLAGRLGTGGFARVQQHFGFAAYLQRLEEHLAPRVAARSWPARAVAVAGGRP
ncbi:MAG: glycosyltransferase family 4 protein [Candidatus Latescibacterota bacterium]